MHLNNKYALDGRDPNSYTGILWCFGLFDRPWAPERTVLGRLRYMSSENTAKKFRLGPYLDYVDSLPKTRLSRAPSAGPSTGRPDCRRAVSAASGPRAVWRKGRADTAVWSRAPPRAGTSDSPA